MPKQENIINHIKPDQISGLLSDHFSSLMSEFYEMQTDFLKIRYKIHKCLQTSNIIICFIKNTHLSIVRQREKNLDYNISLNNFLHNLSEIESSKLKIVSIVNTTGIPKETVRRKIKKLIQNEIVFYEKKNREYYWNLSRERSQNFLKIMDSDIRAISKFVLGITKSLNLHLSLEDIEKEIKSQFSFYFYHFLNCQLIWIKMWQNNIKDIDLIFIAMQALIPTLKYKDKNIDIQNIGLENINTIVGRTSEEYKKSDTSVSAASISEITGIPRATCIRKLERLIKLGLLIRETKTKRYFVNQSTSGRTKHIITKDNINFTIATFSEYLSIIINALIRKK